MLKTPSIISSPFWFASPTNLAPLFKIESPSPNTLLKSFSLVKSYPLHFRIANGKFNSFCKAVSPPTTPTNDEFILLFTMSKLS